MVWEDTRAGNIASEMAVTDLGAAWVSSEIETVNQVREWFAEHLEAVNRRIHLAWARWMSTKEWERH